ncbi:hypothetical protein [Actinomadura sp. WMMA1423]|uniref:hypothetical protein n=1 Tax=Actinomadura sp. WMMA1423 TaxID=2591108 RepID=UPI001146A4C0|nr:hypothetical protein [Actinomadura sp. WMMA1423]
MAYAEKRGRYWRGRYRNPPGVKPALGTVSATPDGWPFTRRRDAERAAEDKESELRRLASQWDGPPAHDLTLDQWKRALAGRLRARGGRDPYAGEITLREWVESKWLPAQDIEDSSRVVYDQHLRLRIFPTLGDWPINTLYDREQIQAWELALRGRYAPNTVDNARNLLATILGDARDAGLVDDNAASRRKRRGKVSERRLQASRAARRWATPLEALLLAERCAILTGRDDDFVMWTVCAWCGLRWGEVMGLQRHHVLETQLVVDVQLAPPDGPFRCRPPKDGSIRNNHRDFFGAADLPPSLSALLDRFMTARPPASCDCPGEGCGGDRFLFLAEDGGHHLHRTYAGGRPWQQAARGMIPARRPRPGRSGGAPARPVLVDLASGWPGAPLAPAWPAATGPDWSPPSVRGIPRYDQPVVDALAVDCPRCPALAGEACKSPSGGGHTHRPRVAAARALGHVRELVLASWLPIGQGLTPHGFRHSHRVWLDEIGTPAVLAHDRLGHSLPGIGGTYAHVSPMMREQLRERLEALWVKTLDERLALAPHSRVGLLDELLVARGASLP